ncbi:MAG TPA: tail fiber domain-containing protein [Blastocatellia bacterium]|nr:tail fiber domain-containing protein [Blastocatellia bacterium]
MSFTILSRRDSVLLGLILLVLSAGVASAQTTTFAYQGKLTDNGSPANGNYDFEFKLFNDISAGFQQGAALQQLNIVVANGVYSVTLDFGATVFTGKDRFLEIGYRAAGGGAFTVLSPREQILSAPYSIKSLAASSADTLSVDCVNCVTSSQIQSVAGSAVTGAIPVASVPAGSNDYIQNRTGQQVTANFNINGTGTAGTFNAATHFSINGNRVLTAYATTTLAGFGTGAANTTGFSNSFFGYAAGSSNTSACCNAFFGAYAGQANTTGRNNAFFGYAAGQANTEGRNNSFFGNEAGNFNTTGADNAFFGTSAGNQNTTGSSNAFFGYHSGASNTTGGANSFFGNSAGYQNTSGSNNSFFGGAAGYANTSGVNNAFFGISAGRSNSTGDDNAFFGTSTGRNNTTGTDNAFFGNAAGYQNTSGSNNAFFGRNAGNSNTTGNNNTIIGQNADVSSGNLSFAAAVGAGATVSTSNTVVLGRTGDSVRVPGNLVVVTLGAAGSTSLCRNGSNQIATCSSSLRYKTDVRSFDGGLDIIGRLRPITFKWNQDGMRDLGFGAEEVEQVEPLLVTRNDTGEIEGVKYAQITAVLVNAIRQQQAQIDALKKIVCQDHPEREFCK